MAVKVKFFIKTDDEILSMTSSIDGAIYFTNDGLNVYKGNGNTPRLYTGIQILSQRPISPVPSKLYIIKLNETYNLEVYDNGEWHNVSGGDDGFKPIVFWDFNSDTSSDWSLGLCTLSTPSSSVTRFTATGANSYMLRSLSVNGGQNQIVKIRCAYVSGTKNYGRVYYTTAGHGNTEAYHKDFDLGIAGEFTTITLDMSQLDSGGTDWISNTITGIRFDFDDSANIIVDIDWLAIGKEGWGTQYFEDDLFFRNSNLTIQDTRTVATASVFTKEYSFYDYLGKAAAIRFEHNGYNADVPRKLVFNVNNIDALTLGYQGIATFSNVVYALSGNSTQWNTAYAHSQIVTGNPHNINLADIGESYASINYWTKTGNELSYTAGEVSIGGGNVNTSVDYTYNRIASTLTPTGDNGNLDFVGTHVLGQCNNTNYYINSAIGLRVSQNTTGEPTIEQYSLWVDQATGSGNNYAARFNGNIILDGFIKAGGFPLYFPTSAGTVDYVLTTNGAGVLSWTPGITAEPGGGILTLGSQAQVNQSFANGSGISVTSTGGVHTITNTYSWSARINGSVFKTVTNGSIIDFANSTGITVVNPYADILRFDFNAAAYTTNSFSPAFHVEAAGGAITWNVATYPNIYSNLTSDPTVTLDNVNDGDFGAYRVFTNLQNRFITIVAPGKTLYVDSGSMTGGASKLLLQADSRYLITFACKSDEIWFNVARYNTF